jgi:hypothetical protein
MIGEIQNSYSKNYSYKKNYLVEGIARWDDDGGAPMGRFEFLAQHDAQHDFAQSLPKPFPALPA